jgi:DNA-binding PadR family transcriptional regulator
MLILRDLALQPLRGNDVVAWICEAIGGVLAIEEGAWYTALHRMEARAWLSSEWATSAKGRATQSTTA